VPAHVIRSGQPLAGDFDIEQEARSIPGSNVVKGMFFNRMVELIGSGWDSVKPTLVDPPRGARYVTFRDYPQSDYMRVTGAAAKKRHFNVPLREGIRRLARDDFDVFSASTFGRVILAVVGDARAALHRVPYVYSKLAVGDYDIRVEDLDARTVRIEFAPLYGRWEYTVGQFEGIVLHFGYQPTTRVEELPELRLRFDVEHV